MPTRDLRVERIQPAELPAWDRLTAGSFFASRGFLDLWRTRGGRPVAWMAEADGAPAAIVPGVEFGRGPLARFVSLPDGCYGGVFADPSVEADRGPITRALFDAIVRRRYAKASVFDYHASAGAHPSFAIERGETLLADISHPDWVPADRKLQSQIRKARRSGVRVEDFDWSRHAPGFLALVHGTARHHGAKPRYARRFYRELAKLAARDERVRWIHCEHDGRPASSHIYFVERDTLQAWQSHFDRSFSFLKANQFIRFTQCREAARRGVRWLNLGSSPAGADGVAYYKARWGGRHVRFATWTRMERLGILADRVLGRAVPSPEVPAPEPATNPAAG